MWQIERDSHVCTTCAILSHCVCVCVAVLQWQISECEAQIQALTEELNTWSYFKVSPIVSYPMYVANSNL